MKDSILRLYPGPQQEVPLKDLYLGHDLRQLPIRQGETFVYSNFITSLDGRIAIPHATRKRMVVPGQIANPRDWRLVQELTTQADILITSGRYLRGYAKGHVQKILGVYEDPLFVDLKEWRLSQGLAPEPDLAVVSASLDFPIPEELTRLDHSIVVITSHNADLEQIKTIEARLGTVVLTGKERVEGGPLIERLSEMGYRFICSATGPKVQHMLLKADVLDRQYLTIAGRILGGDPFSSIVEGPLLDPPLDFRLRTLYFDPHGLDGSGQLFASYDRVRIPHGSEKP
jgi:riboflavin biosynthesis pyrimidine reductase